METAWHAVSAAEVMKKLGTSPLGLSEREAALRVKQYGENRIKDVKTISPLKIFFEQVNSLLIYILLAAALVSAFLGEWADFIAITAIILLNSILGFIQQYRAEKAIQNLKKMLIPNVKVIREGKIREIPATSLVPGDIIEVNEGDRVMADARIIAAENLQINEAVLTGESMPTEKTSDEQAQTSTLSEWKNIAFMGTYAETGIGKAVVVQTGMTTQFGKIAKMLQEPETGLTPLQKKINTFSKQLGILLIAFMVVFFIVGISVGVNPLDMFLGSVSLAVAAIPEGLVATITIGLAFAVGSMSKVNALIRKLPAAETLGRVTVICSDKTGTMTREELTVTEIFCNNTSARTEKGFDSFLANEKDARMMLKAACLSSNARVESAKAGGEYFIGDPTEKALIKLAFEHGMSKKTLTESEPRVKEFPFSSQRKMMTIVRKRPDSLVSYSKGSPEAILERCAEELRNGKGYPLSPQRKNEILKVYETMAGKALRVIAVAYKTLPAYKEKNVSEQTAEHGLTFIGLQGMIDPPRQEVKEAVMKCQRAGIAIKMITGDSLMTAQAVAHDVGLQGKAISGKELKEMSDEELMKQIQNIAIFARTDPADKVRIVMLLKTMGEIVAVTGDGVNDAPALRKSDIGIAMGIRGSDVTRDVADMILLDDNFASIVNAVEKGREVYDNIKKFTYYLLSSNFAEILIIFLALLIGSQLGWKTLLPLVPLQLLWINLVTDGIIAITLSRCKAEDNIMGRKPESGNILTWKVGMMLSAIALIITIPTLIFFSFDHHDFLRAQTVAFTMIVFFEGFNAFNFSSFKNSALKIKENLLIFGAVALTFILQIAVMYVPFLQKIFHTTALGMEELFVLVAVASSVFIAGEFYKILAYSRERKQIVK